MTGALLAGSMAVRAKGGAQGVGHVVQTVNEIRIKVV
jgi:hypothetical protein